MARQIQFVRLGGVLPTLLTFPVLVILRVAGGGAGQLALIVGALVLIGQTTIWRAMFRLRGSEAWADGVVFQLLVGGVLSSQTLFLTGIPALMPIPFLPPLVGLFAKWRFKRSGQAGVAR